MMMMSASSSQQQQQQRRAATTVRGAFASSLSKASAAASASAAAASHGGAAAGGAGVLRHATSSPMLRSTTGGSSHASLHSIHWDNPPPPPIFYHHNNPLNHNHHHHPQINSNRHAAASASALGIGTNDPQALMVQMQSQQQQQQQQPLLLPTHHQHHHHHQQHIRSSDAALNAHTAAIHKRTILTALAQNVSQIALLMIATTTAALLLPAAVLMMPVTFMVASPILVVILLVAYVVRALWYTYGMHRQLTWAGRVAYVTASGVLKTVAWASGVARQLGDSIGGFRALIGWRPTTRPASQSSSSATTVAVSPYMEPGDVEAQLSLANTPSAADDDDIFSPAPHNQIHSHPQSSYFIPDDLYPHPSPHIPQFFSHPHQHNPYHHLNHYQYLSSVDTDRDSIISSVSETPTLARSSHSNYPSQITILPPPSLRPSRSIDRLDSAYDTGANTDTESIISTSTNRTARPHLGTVNSTKPRTTYRHLTPSDTHIIDLCIRLNSVSAAATAAGSSSTSSTTLQDARGIRVATATPEGRDLHILAALRRDADAVPCFEDLLGFIHYHHATADSRHLTILKVMIANHPATAAPPSSDPAATARRLIKELHRRRGLESVSVVAQRQNVEFYRLLGYSVCVGAAAAVEPVDGGESGGGVRMLWGDASSAAGAAAHGSEEEMGRIGQVVGAAAC